MQNFTYTTSIKKMVLLLCLQLIFINAFTQVQVVSGGAGQTNANPNNAANGGNASGLGCGGGGANYYGGNGGSGMFGGGGGGAAGLGALNMIGGAGGKGVVVVATYIGASYVSTTVCQFGSSYTVGAAITAVKVWAIGAGGGGAGSTNNDGTVGGGGGAGGVAYITKSVTTGDVITYSLGTAGAGGINSSNGVAGGNTTATITGTTITGYGGGAGQYNNSIDAAGGSFSGGDGGAAGGAGKGAAGDVGGGGGGGIGGVIGGTPPGGNGGTGANAADVSGLFAALASGTLLPVSWKAITVTNQKNGALLQWETAMELNTLNFTIQYSTDGINFNDIATVAATNNSTGSVYSYLHQNALPVTGYYRIYQTDRNGKNSFSNMVKNSYRGAAEKDFILTTNTVVNGNISIQLNKATVINLLSLDGKLVFSKSLGAGLQNIDVSRLAKGYYAVQSTSGSEKIIIQ